MSVIRASRRETGVGPWIVSILGVVLADLSFWFVIQPDFGFFAGGGAEESVVLLRIVEAVLMVVFSGTLIYAGYWLANSKYDQEQTWWAALWSILGLAGIVSVIVLVQAHQIAAGNPVDRSVVIEEIIMGAGGGGIAGLLIGLATARAMWNAEEVAEQRNSFEFLNKLLRHNVLNGVQIIHGHATRLDRKVDDDARSHIDTIENRSESIAALTQNARRVAQTFSGDSELEPVLLSDVLTEEIHAAQMSFDEAAFEVSVPEGVHVRANGSLAIVFENVLANAVEHNDSDDPCVDIDVDVGESTILVSIADNGPGVSPDERAELFEPGDEGDHGFGLYLVNTLVEHYGGEMWVADSDAGGAVFQIELRRATPE
ncbi:hypothetical protein BRD17_02320 [Halobacteriales archaeon SW_7_68_16]|nr:MAG: hypothetical protein BRD17_02320 [Halobacteriales archaeon SW_7_68_16]